MKKLLFILAVGLTSAAAPAATISFNGTVQAGNLTSIPWVIAPGPTQTFMWGTVDTADAVATGQSGFTSLNSANISLLTWTFGRLDLTGNLSPGPGSPGFEMYENLAVTEVPFTISYNGSVWATGHTNYLRDDVSDDHDLSATGTGEFFLSAPGVDSTFFNEVMVLTSNTGLFDANITAFNPVNNAGLFTAVGTIYTVPEPGVAAVLGGLVAMGMVWVRRRRSVKGLRD